MPESRQVLAALDAGMVRVADMVPIFGVTKQRCDQLTRRPHFPAPVKVVPGRRLWRRSEVVRWRDEIWARPWVPQG